MIIFSTGREHCGDLQNFKVLVEKPEIKVFRAGPVTYTRSTMKILRSSHVIQAHGMGEAMNIAQERFPRCRVSVTKLSETEKEILGL